MRKRIFLTLVLSLCMADFGAFAATARRGGGAPAAGNGGGTVAARSATRTNNGTTVPKVKATVNAVEMPGKPSADAARAGKKQTVKAAPMAARAGATQKVINAGTKVAAATANTVVDTECQNAFFGCMDTFCMMDNASGGRCQCSDRITELDKALEEIIKLDEQTYVMATEGVERIKMGESAEAIIARAKTAGDSALGKGQQAAASDNKTKARTLDLSAWDKSVFDDDGDVFDNIDQSIDGSAVSDAMNKTGVDLYKDSAKNCIALVPDKCKASVQMLQSIYAQKIKSDCVAYENSLKQQKIASTKKLQAAQKALRDAALEEYQDQNTYKTLGECVVALKKCVQTTGECGSDFAGCVADNNILGVLYSKTSTTSSSSSKVTTFKMSDSVTVSKATYDNVQNAAMKCESVVKQCVNANGGKDLLTGPVYKQFVKDVAPAVYSIEYSMASNSRMNCIATIVNCVKKSCKSEGMDQDSTNYDACLSNPDSIKNYCSLEIPKCGDTMSQNDVLKYVAAKLAADKVDACTEEVTACLTADNACGKDYSGCIGLNTQTIADLCPVDKLTACADKHNSDSVRDYVNQIALGLSLKIDNSLLTTCQKALDDAMVTYCGEEKNCPKVTVSDVAFKEANKLQLCKSGTTVCHDTAAGFTDEEILAGDIIPRLVGRIQTSLITYIDPTEDDPYGGFGKDPEATALDIKDGYDTEKVSLLVKSMNESYKSKITSIESDQKVQYCMKGRVLQTTSGENKGKADGSTARFPNLTQAVRLAILETIMQRTQELSESVVKERKDEETKKLVDDLTARMEKIAEVNEARIDAINDATCTSTYLDPPNFSHRWGRSSTWGTKGVYDKETNVCTETYTTYPCKKYYSPYCWGWDQTGTDGWKKPHPMKKWDGKTIVAEESN